MAVAKLIWSIQIQKLPYFRPKARGVSGTKDTFFGSAGTFTWDTYWLYTSLHVSATFG